MKIQKINNQSLYNYKPAVSLILVLIFFIISSKNFAETYDKKALTDNSSFTASELLGRPTDKSVLVNIIPGRDMDIIAEYGASPGIYSGRTKPVLFTGGKPAEIIIDNLKPDTLYYYRISYREKGKEKFTARDEHFFHTQRKKGAAFTFTIQADPHLGTDKHCSPEVYKKTLLNALKDRPDFHFDLGDTFRASKLGKADYRSVEKLYLNHRYYFDLLCHSAPLFLVIGNHELELGSMLNNTPENIPIWSVKSRKLYYPNPAPDGFYTGNTKKEPFTGLLNDYYAWEWGDALFIVLDPYWYTAVDPKEKGDLWNLTYGNDQYKWLKKTLESSKARFKFAFVHHILGNTRGAVDRADECEWGGKSRNGEYEFNKKRPGWEMPIHQLMNRNNVTIIFQGHDHIFAMQRLDNIVYQECPMPADPYYSYYNRDAYPSAETMPNAGHIRVTVTGTNVKVDYIRAYLPEEEKEGRKNGETAYSYEINKDNELKTLFKMKDVFYKNNIEKDKGDRGGDKKRGGRKK